MTDDDLSKGCALLFVYALGFLTGLVLGLILVDLRW